MSTIGFTRQRGIYEALPLNDVREVEYDTPYGEPSDDHDRRVQGTREGSLPPAARRTSRCPTDLPTARTYVLKGGRHVHLRVERGGSLKAELEPGTLCRRSRSGSTTGRSTATSFYGDWRRRPPAVRGPVQPELVDHLTEVAESAVGGDGRVTPPTTRTS